jgi:septal ring factor EnvC (AmiA/AmiB activator)
MSWLLKTGKPRDRTIPTAVLIYNIMKTTADIVRDHHRITKQVHKVIQNAEDNLEATRTMIKQSAQSLIESRQKHEVSRARLTDLQKRIDESNTKLSKRVKMTSNLRTDVTRTLRKENQKSKVQ